VKDAGTLIAVTFLLRHEGGVAVLDLVGNSTVLGSLGNHPSGGRACETGFLGEFGPIEDFNPLLQMPSGVPFSVFGSVYAWHWQKDPVTMAHEGGPKRSGPF